MSELVKVMNIHGMDVSRIERLKSVFSCFQCSRSFACVLSVYVLWLHDLQYRLFSVAIECLYDATELSCWRCRVALRCVGLLLMDR